MRRRRDGKHVREIRAADAAPAGRKMHPGKGVENLSIQLSARLAAVARLTKGAERLADIGTDHGYLPVYLVQRGELKSAVAMDVNRGPLLRAQEHIRQYHLEEKISTRLSDGAQELLPGEADCVVIAGMGGPLTIKILSEGRRQLAQTETFVLQPQSEIESVRRFLHAEGFRITAEDMVKDDGKFYPMMKAVRAGSGGGETARMDDAMRIQNTEDAATAQTGDAARMDDAAAQNRNTARMDDAAAQNRNAARMDDTAAQNRNAVRTDDAPWEDYEYCFGRYLILQKNPVLLEFLQKEEATCRAILEKLRGLEKEKAAGRRAELEKRLRMIEQSRQPQIPAANEVK
ncbi:hypothetical protein BRYFOR_07785 [Marvinbryantia formatexigens DSM 14469]|uniref:SAM-dependent methyltransferase n=1 Tax=Marvinbryantia formatexigens DSM 14469 TaxID=478749 RepID=C6LGM5_9FIRM|nr:hypothetical protein BRYFOR_07785 [Marvinbryantia formatexigens DSM 14469]